MSKTTKIVLISWSAVILVLVLVNILVSLGNDSIQTEMGERQQEIAQTIQLENLNRQLIAVLANMALKTNDAQLKKVLADSGINLDAPAQSGAGKN